MNSHDVVTLQSKLGKVSNVCPFYQSIRVHLLIKGTVTGATLSSQNKWLIIWNEPFVCLPL